MFKVSGFVDRTRGKYVSGETEERFTCIMSLVFVLCAVNYVYAVVVSALVLKQGRDETAWSYYAVSSFTYLTAMVTSNKALTWVNYPTQVVGKSCKPIPVMVLGVVIGRKRYPLLKYLFVLTIVAGVALFMYKGDALCRNRIIFAKNITTSFHICCCLPEEISFSQNFVPHGSL